VEENPTQEIPADEPAPEAVEADGGGADGVGNLLNVIA
jgi:hypothetical protein